ncbi:MAG: WXG100 family type VII secretion target [Ruminococcus sp.]|nr:WXG100 family type VII secretion target [Ruminococcus sp.]
MAMGTTGTVNVTPEMMKAALAAIETYRSTTSTIFETLDGVVTGLIPSNFSGSAADGFSSFFTNKITPVATDSLKGMLDALDSICQGILDAIPEANGVDEQLATANNQ